MRRPREIGWAAAALLACHGGEPPLERAPVPERSPTRVEADPPTLAREPPAQPQVRVATYNILSGERGLAGVIETLENTKADIIAIQEVDRNTRRAARTDQPEQIGEALGLEVAFQRHRRLEGGETGLALLSRFPIEDVERVGSREGPLAMLSAWVQTPTQRIRILVVHFYPTEPGAARGKARVADQIRLHQAERASFLMTDAARPTVILGDFNAPPASPTYRLIGDHFTDACERKPFPTYPAAAPNTRIDYVWFSRHFTAKSCASSSSKASDHLPVVVELEVGQPEIDGEMDGLR